MNPFDTQELALLDLYWSTNGPSWTPGVAANWVVNVKPLASFACNTVSRWANIGCNIDRNIV
jgi:hypothetical protein